MVLGKVHGELGQRREAQGVCLRNDQPEATLPWHFELTFHIRAGHAEPRLLRHGYKPRPDGLRG